MTRFDADTEETRRELFADAIHAHTERDSAFLTVEAEVDESVVTDETDDEPATVAPWVQFADGVVNLDCADDELDRIETLLDEYPEFRIDALETPEDADGTNLRIAARTDPKRVAGFTDRVFREAYECAADYRAWVTAV